MGCVRSLCFEFYYRNLPFFLSSLRKRREKKEQKQKRESTRQGIRRTFLFLPRRRPLLESSRSLKFSLSSPLIQNCDGDCIRKVLYAYTPCHRLEEDRNNLRVGCFVPVFSRAKMRGGELGVFYVDLTNYFASVSSSRPLQSLVSSFKRKRVGSVRYPMWVPY